MQQTTPQSQAYLVIQLGSRWTDILRLQPDQVVSIGRSSENLVVVADERASRRHAEISRHDGGWQVSDLGSRNGTQVGGCTIAGPCPLSGGEVIVVGNCQMTFTYQLSDAFAQGTHRGPSQEQVTVDVSDAPAIVGRLSRSQWSAELDRSPPARGNNSDRWSFFYRLIVDLVGCSTADEAAGLALDRLLAELGITAGGVVRFDLPGAAATSPEGASAESLRGAASLIEGESAASQPLPGRPAKSAPLGMAVLAARQPVDSTYHRVSDFLIATVVRERQAILARNVRDDGLLSLARVSGQRDATSILCAPLLVPQAAGEDLLVGLLHVYTQGDQRMLTADDLGLAAGVADNLAMALTTLQQNQQLADHLEASRRRADHLEEQLQLNYRLIGDSPALGRVKQAIGRAAPTEATILIRGESGVGKELVARAIHLSSHRRDGPMVCLNCAALAPTLLESELFGHEKGAFTGATERKIGKFEAAHRGTLMLDEIGELPVELQAKLLRVLEGHAFERLGGQASVRADVRVIAATNRDLEEAVQAKQFRADLYYRLRVIEIPVPPLRERRQDIPALAEYFLGLLAPHAHRQLLGIEPAAMELLVRHDWPGNIRELRNAIERAVVLGSGRTIGSEDLGLSLLGRPSAATEPAQRDGFRPLPLAEVEKKHIMAVLDYVEGNKSRAAQMLGIERSTLDRKLKRYAAQQ